MTNGAYYNELEPYPCRVIEANIRRGRLPAGRVHCGDIRAVSPSDVASFGQVHLFAGIGAAAYACRLAGIPDDFPIWIFGFPCQDISSAGKGKGLSGSRSGLFFEAMRLVKSVRPTWILIENVPALRTRGIQSVIKELEGAGYTVLPPIVVGADDVEAPHRRKRVWIVARRIDELVANPSEQRWRAECHSANIASAPRRARTEFAGSSYSAELVNSTCSRGWGLPAPNQRPDFTDFDRTSERMAYASNERCKSAIGQLPAWESNLERSGEGMADANGSMCDRCRESGARGRAESSNGGSELANPQSLGVINVCGIQSDLWLPNNGAQWADRQSCSRCGGQLADANDSGRREQRAAIAVPAPHITVECCGNVWRWPSRPGQPQHDWEEPRTVEPPMGGAANGSTRQLVRSWTTWRRNALKGLGNAWVPQTAVPILKWIYQHETTRHSL